MISANFLMLVGAGFLGGVANAIAGGATLITFPAMLLAGLPPIIANASNAVAVTPGHLLAACADWKKLPPLNAFTVKSTLATLLGGIIGAALLLFTPEYVFSLLVPALMGLATLVFAFARSIQFAMAKPRADTGLSEINPAYRIAMLGPAAVYGGYFGGGLGVILLAILPISGREDLRSANVLKNLLATAVSVTTLSIFTIRGAVRWPETIVMLVGAIVEGFLGGRLVRRLSSFLIRTIVIVGGVLMTAIYVWRYWL